MELLLKAEFYKKLFAFLFLVKEIDWQRAPNRKIKRGLIYVKRFSKKLKDLINKNKSDIDLIDINSWKFRIKKEE